MLSLVGRVASASASGALRGLGPSASLPQAQLLLRAAPAAVHPGKRLPRGAGRGASPRDLEPGPRRCGLSPGRRAAGGGPAAGGRARSPVGSAGPRLAMGRRRGRCLDLVARRGTQTRGSWRVGFVHEVAERSGRGPHAFPARRRPRPA